MMDNMQMQQPDADVGGQEEPNEPGTQAFTIDPGHVEQGIKKQMNAKQIANLNRVLDQGNKLLFGKDSHYQLMNGLKDSKDIPGDLGNGAFSMLMMLFKGGGYTMPTDIMDATGTILLARACSFLNKAQVATVTDDDYEEAVHIYTVKLHSTLDPKFKERMAQATGGDQQPPVPDAGGAQPPATPDASGQPPQPTGILNQGVQP